MHWQVVGTVGDPAVLGYKAGFSLAGFGMVAGLVTYCLSLTLHYLSLTLHYLFLTFHCLSPTVHCLSVPFIDLSRHR